MEARGFHRPAITLSDRQVWDHQEAVFRLFWNTLKLTVLCVETTLPQLGE